MRLRRLVLKLVTDKSNHGATIDFPDGLVVLWADNSMGKSTCLKSIMWALGLEAMLTVSQSDVPLPEAMKVKLLTTSGAANVIESEVFLELQNSAGESIVVNRAVKAARDIHLVTVTFGPELTKPTGAAAREDFLVGRPGGATSKKGFHQFLASFLGWNIPEVLTFDGRSCPLYLQCIFPYFMVEQTRGWATLQPPTPTQFRIREVHKRVLEFLLKMDAYRIAARRQQLADHENRLLNEWSGLIREAKLIAHQCEGQLQGIPAAPTASWPPQMAPLLLVFHDAAWRPINSVVTAVKAEGDRLANQEIPRVSEVAAAASNELAEAERKLRERESLYARVQAALEAEKGEANALETRIALLDDDLRKNKDVQTLQNLGSTHSSTLSVDECPTCHQALKDTLLPLPEIQSVMSIDDNIRFLTEQKRTFVAARNNSLKLIDARTRQLSAMLVELNELRRSIRGLRQTLVADGRLPSIAAIRARLEAEETAKRLESTLDQFSKLLEQFADCSLSWRTLLAEKTALPATDLTEADRAKVAQWSHLFTQQLHQYGFKSFGTSEIGISGDSLRPEREGFDLPSNISASDFIRVIWAYLNGLLEVARSTATNHPGLLVFDEPKQQSTKDLSFRELLTRVGSAGAAGQQVVFATSEDRSRLASALSGVPHTCVEFKDRIIQPTAQ